MQINLKRRQLMLGLMGAPIFLSLLNSSLANETVAQPVTPTDKNYGKVLNSIASLVMAYYAYTLDPKRNASAYFLSDQLQIPSLLDENEQLQGILLMDAKLTQNKQHYLFSVKNCLKYQRDSGVYQKDIEETFHFEKNATQTIDAIALIQSSSGTEIPLITRNSAFNTLSDYQKRQWVYAWAAFLNRQENASLWLKQNPLSNIPYVLKIGNYHFNGTMSDAFDVHKMQIGEGQYLLREMHNKETDGEKTITLYFDFHGKKDEQNVIANIEQTMEYQSSSDDSFIIKQMTERHLIPNPKPWQKILC